MPRDGAPSQAEGRQNGGHDPKASGSNLQQLPLGVGAAVDALLRFQANRVCSLLGWRRREGGALRLTQAESSLDDPSLPAPLRLDLPVRRALNTDLDRGVHRDVAPHCFILAEAAVGGALCDDRDPVSLVGSDPARLVLDDAAVPVAAAFMDRLILTPLSADLRAHGG